MNGDITIIDYGAGNLRSVQNTLDAVGAGYKVVQDTASVEQASKIILPGVGHFGQMMRALEEKNLFSVLKERIRAGVPFLGICLGMQALFEGSEEAPELAGFGLLPGVVKRFPAGARVPHMGWNRLSAKPGSKLVRDGDYVYFAHSFFAPVVPATAATCEYGVRYTAAIESSNIHGVQFHPEKSGPLGLNVVRRFVGL
ncbi:MAG TPA: imidazole glycerol phosphate synthase subunit HisH [Bryobacteraceae bacterium]|nr:imidazole glycerol phosphate synthase subunit HisH [Bryobacteraceae bacterium]